MVDKNKKEKEEAEIKITKLENVDLVLETRLGTKTENSKSKSYPVGTEIIDASIGTKETFKYENLTDSQKIFFSSNNPEFETEPFTVIPSHLLRIKPNQQDWVVLRALLILADQKGIRRNTNSEEQLMQITNSELYKVCEIKRNSNGRLTNYAKKRIWESVDYLSKPHIFIRNDGHIRIKFSLIEEFSRKEGDKHFYVRLNPNILPEFSDGKLIKTYYQDHEDFKKIIKNIEHRKRDTSFYLYNYVETQPPGVPHKIDLINLAYKCHMNSYINQRKKKKIEKLLDEAFQNLQDQGIIKSWQKSLGKLNQILYIFEKEDKTR